jgi:hypothetical protein
MRGRDCLVEGLVKYSGKILYSYVINFNSHVIKFVKILINNFFLLLLLLLLPLRSIGLP